MSSAASFYPSSTIQVQIKQNCQLIDTRSLPNPLSMPTEPEKWESSPSHPSKVELLSKIKDIAICLKTVFPHEFKNLIGSGFYYNNDHKVQLTNGTFGANLTLPFVVRRLLKSTAPYSSLIYYDLYSYLFRAYTNSQSHSYAPNPNRLKFTDGTVIAITYPAQQFKEPSELFEMDSYVYYHQSPSANNQTNWTKGALRKHVNEFKSFLPDQDPLKIKLEQMMLAVEQTK